VMSATRRLSGWTAPQSLLADRVYPHLRKVGPAALIGLSNDAPSTSHIPRALSEARFALEYANVAMRVMRASDIPFQQMLVSKARDGVQNALPAWLDALVNADTKGRLAATLRAYADCDMNVLRTAKHLDVHPNTIYARMQKIGDVTGLDALSYHSLTEMLLALDCRGAAD
jgi:sugar diacid utilization regulator